MRLDPALRTQLEAAAKAAGRSLHAEISMRLEESLKREPMLTNSDLPLTLEDIRKVAQEVVRDEMSKAGIKLTD
jgi:hypothetical protein